MGQKTRTFLRKLFRLEKRQFIVQYFNQQKIGEASTRGRAVVIFDHDEEWSSSTILKVETILKEENQCYSLYITGVNPLKG